MVAPIAGGTTQDISDRVADHDGRDLARNATEIQHVDGGNALVASAASQIVDDHHPAGRRFTADEARDLTTKIKSGAQALWAQLLRAYEGGAHLVLGFSSWSEYCCVEFEFERSQAYRVLEYGRVNEIVSTKSQICDSPLPPIPNPSVASQLAPLRGDPVELRATYAEAAATAPIGDDGEPRITAAHVRDVRERRHRAAEPADGDANAVEADVLALPVGAKGLRPNDTEPPAPKKPKPAIGLNQAVSALKRAVERDRDSAPAALATLREVASRGLYGPKTKDVPSAFRELVGIVEMLLGGAK